jgi:hypothetical protein
MMDLMDRYLIDQKFCEKYGVAQQSQFFKHSKENWLFDPSRFRKF